MDGIENVKVTVNFGYIRLVQVSKVDTDGSLLMGGYAVHYDMDGCVVKQTPVEYYSRLTFA